MAHLLRTGNEGDVRDDGASRMGRSCRLAVVRADNLRPRMADHRERHGPEELQRLGHQRLPSHPEDLRQPGVMVYFLQVHMYVR